MSKTAQHGAQLQIDDVGKVKVTLQSWDGKPDNYRGWRDRLKSALEHKQLGSLFDPTLFDSTNARHQALLETHHVETYDELQTAWYHVLIAVLPYNSHEAARAKEEATETTFTSLLRALDNAVLGVSTTRRSELVTRLHALPPPKNLAALVNFLKHVQTIKSQLATLDTPVDDDQLRGCLLRKLREGHKIEGEPAFQYILNASDANDFQTAASIEVALQRMVDRYNDELKTSQLIQGNNSAMAMPFVRGGRGRGGYSRGGRGGRFGGRSSGRWQNTAPRAPFLPYAPRHMQQQQQQQYQQSHFQQSNSQHKRKNTSDGNFQQSTQAKQPRGPSPSTCWYCGKKGHAWRECYSYLRQQGQQVNAPYQSYHGQGYQGQPMVQNFQGQPMFTPVYPAQAQATPRPFVNPQPVYYGNVQPPRQPAVDLSTHSGPQVLEVREQQPYVHPDQSDQTLFRRVMQCTTIPSVPGFTHTEALCMHLGFPAADIMRLRKYSLQPILLDTGASITLAPLQQ